MEMGQETEQGFTLIELSIVLVIIGLLVGSVLAGQDLIRAAGIRATLSQIEEYNAAANTFRGKYGYLPGDIKDPEASSFGLGARGPNAGEGDGNGIIEGIFNTAPGSNYGFAEDGGETVMFWVDLSTVHLIKNGFSTATSSTIPPITGSTTAIPLYLPEAKLGHGNYIYVWSNNGLNYYGFSAVTTIAGDVASTPTLTVQEAYGIDKKTDDGYPQLGRITAQYINSANGVEWSAGGGAAGAYPATAAASSSTTCYDNGGSATSTMQYSLKVNNGSNTNCALSIQFQ